MSRRVYKVTWGDFVSLVRAANAAQARNHVARHSIDVEVASQQDLIDYLTATPPMRIEDAGAEREAEIPRGIDPIKEGAMEDPPVQRAA